MATLAVDTPRDLVIGKLNDIPMITADIIYEGAAVGIVIASGHARPLTSVDKFAGFAQKKCDNSAGAAAALNVKVISSGKIQLSVSGAVITDVGQPVYATDDNVFVFSPVGAVYIGKVIRFVSAGVVEVQFDAIKGIDPWAGYVREAIAAAHLLDLNDSGKALFITATAAITLPDTSVEFSYTIVNMGPFGTVEPSIIPATDDKIVGPDINLADNATLTNTLATAQRGDFVKLQGGAVNGPIIHAKKGIWA